MANQHLYPRGAVSEAKSVANTFSSWDNCMTEAYCKWPAIIGIVLACLVVLGVVFCLARCLCCGLECCCGCFSCLNCCRPRGRNKRSRYADEPQRYGGDSSYQGHQPSPNAPPAYEPPRFAQFETSSKNKSGTGNEDALPAMPSWDHASSKKVEDTNQDQDVEMGDLNNHSGGRNFGAATANGPGGRGRYSQLGPNPGSPYAQQPTAYNGANPMQSYDGDIGAQQARPEYDYSRPSPYGNTSFNSAHSQPSATYNAPYDTQYRSPTAAERPQGGFRATPSEDQLQPSALAPTPNMYNHGYDPKEPQTFRSSWTGSSSTKYEPSAQYNQGGDPHHGQTSPIYGQASGPPSILQPGQGQTSPTHEQGNRPPSILQAGRKPVAGSWRDI